MDKLVESIVKPLLKEIELPVKIGDTILMGRFKNKKVKVKSIDFNEKGDLMINNRPALKFRISKSDKKLLPARPTDKDSVSPDADMRGVKESKELKLNIPSDIKKIHKLFKRSGKKLFVVGGAVRDAILGKSPKDFDLATDAKPDEVLAIAKKGGLKTVEVGKQFGVVIVGGHEIATFRKDIGKGRRPSAVDYTDIAGDVKRRDLTINALFYDIDRGDIVDLVGGIADLKKKKIRTVGKASERFDEDPLRKLRALRFHGALGGKMSKDTKQALMDNPSLKGISGERIRDEFVKSIKKAKSTKNYLEKTDELKFTDQILPGLKVSKPYIDENDYILLLAWILRKNDASSLGKKLNKLKYSRDEAQNIQFLNILQNFKPEKIFLTKKFQERTSLTDNQIIQWGKYIGKDLKKMVKFKLSVKGNDVSKDVKGKEIGKAIQKMEKEKFLNEIAARPKPKVFRDIYNALPSDLKKRVMNLKNYDQRRDAHPEGNVLKHTIAVTNRALKTGDIDFALSALFHDIGKDETAGIHPKKGHITHYGHEHVSAKLVKKYRTWIRSMGGNPTDIYFIVKQHMRMKVFDKMKWTKQEKMKKFRAFDKLKKFSKDFDKGGRGINDSLDEKLNPEIKQIYKLLIKYGNSAKDASKMMKKHWKYASKKYRNSSPRGMATAIIGLSLLGENNKAELFKMYTKAMKMMPGSPQQKELIKKISALRKKLKINEIKEQKEIKKTIGIYGGRFQPFHSGHMATYKWLKSQVDDVYITTSDIKKPPRHPMNFKEKVEHMVKMGVPKNRIVMEKSPYIAKNTLKNFDEDTTAVVYAIGQKDASRLGGSYFKRNVDPADMEGYSEHGYLMVAPKSGNLSGTKTREMLGNPKIDDKEKIKFFKKAFGYYDKKMYIKMTKNFSKLFEVYVSLLESSITGDIDSVDDGPHMIAPGVNRYIGRAKKEAEKLGFDIVDSLVNADAYNSQDKLKSHAKPYPDGPVDTVSYGPAGTGEVSSNNVIELVGMEMWLKWMKHIDRILSNQEYEYADRSNDTTKKQAIKGSKETAKQLDKELKESVQRLVSDLPRDGKELLLMGGAYGHMSHPFDNNELTFGDLKKIITNGLGGQLNREDNVTEKTDGQNLMVSWRDGKLIAARNKGHLKNKGETALDIKGVESKFAGRGDIKDAFVYAMRDLSKAVGALSQKQRDKIFGEGSKFMSLEVMWPASENVVNYDITELMFHGAMEYDDSGNVIGQAKDSARMLAGMIKQVNQNIQKHYNIKKPHFMTVPKHQDFGKLKDKFLGRLNKLRSTYGLKDSDTLSMYHQMFWQEFIFNGAKQHKFKINTSMLTKLTKRWAFFDKSYKIPQIKKDMKDNPQFLDWVLTTDKIDKNRMVKDNMKPFEELFFEVGATILKNMDGWMAVNPAKSVQNMRKKVKKAISIVRAGGDLKKLNRLKVQLDRLNAIGGFDAIVPTEGIVFKYKGNTYKFTGAFAPVNQITGMMYF